MPNSIRILILEDNPADVELIQFELEDAQLVFTSKVVMTEEDFVQELQEYCPDIILSDYDLPKYNGALALAEAKRRCPDTPFILVTGAVTEDRAIEILTKGAKDYVLKNRLQQRLAPAVRRALAEAEEQRERKKADEDLREAHRNLESQVAERTADLQKEIEQRYRVEQSLLRYNERLELLSYTASRLLASDNPQQIVEELCLKVMAFLDCDAFFNFLVDETAGRLHLNACAGIPKETMREIEWLDYGVTVCGCAARDACRIVAENIPITPDVRTELVKSFGIKAYACHPLMEQDRVLGTLSFGTRSRTNFSTDDLAMMKAVADQVAIAMSRVRTENALRESESVLRAFFDSPRQPRGVVEVVDDKMRFVSANKVTAAAYGLTPETMRGKFVSELDMPQELMQVYLEGCKGALQKGLVSFEVFHQLPDTGRWFVVTGSYLGNGPTGFPRFAFVMLDITKRKKAEEKMRESEERYRLLAETMLQGVVYQDATGKIIAMNPAAELILGKNREQFLGSSSVDEEHHTIRENGERFPGLEHPSMVALRTGLPVKGVVMGLFNPKLSDYRWITINAVPVFRPGDASPSEVYTVFEDITRRKQAEAKLRRYELLADRHRDVILFIGLDGGHILDANQAATRVYGYSHEQLLTMTIRDLRAADMPGLSADQIATAYGQGLLFEMIHRRQDGSTFPVEVSAQGADIDGRRILISVVRDITQRKRIERELGQRTTALEERTRQMEAANKELESFSYSVSHDLRAPLRAIDGYSRMILKKHARTLDDDAIDKFNVIRDSTRMMGQLIDDLLAFSRAGRAELSTVTLDIGGMIRAAWEEIKAANPDRLLTLKLVEIPPCKGDQGLIKQVLVNILSNAVKFTRGRAEARIEVGGDNQDGKTVYYIRDNGAGFDKQYHHKLFGVFQRLHSDGEFEGTGVGLAIVQRIINRHGGRVWAEGEVDKGATFYFTLPSSENEP